MIYRFVTLEPSRLQYPGHPRLLDRVKLYAQVGIRAGSVGKNKG
jgi:hypothetical protein